jgi:hypothetical protein
MADHPLPPPLAADARSAALAALADRLDALDLSVLLTDLIDMVTAEALPLLAEQFHVLGDEGWALAVTEDQRRSLIKNAIALHRYKGTPWAIHQALISLGLENPDLGWPAEVVEGLHRLTYNGTRTYNGWFVYGDRAKWAHYRVVLTRPLTAEQAERARGLLAAVAPARCVLDALDYSGASWLYDATRRYDGTINYGVA